MQVTIHLSKSEARLCREAVKAFGDLKVIQLSIGDGATILPRGEWHDVAKWLAWMATDFEVKRELSERKAAEKLAARIDSVIEKVTAVLEPPKKPVATAAKQLGLF